MATKNMKNTGFTRGIALLSFLVVAAFRSADAQDVGADAAAVAATVRSFHAALSSGDAAAAARLLAPDAVVLEGGDKETRKQYVEHHLFEDIKFAKAVPSTRGEPEVTVAGDMAWVASTSVMQGTYQSMDLTLVGAELMVLTRTSTGWQIRAIHWSSRKGT
jgi:ketosteroid isomerase-like protein